MDTTLLHNPKYRRWVSTMVAVVFLIGIAIAFVPYYLGSKRMEKFCAGLATGTSIDAVHAQAAGLDYEVLPLADGRFLVHDPLAMGRRDCDVKFGDAGLLTAVFSTGESVFAPPQGGR